MPAKTRGWGGVQRFASALHSALDHHAEVEPIWFHPDADVPRTIGSWARSSTRGLASLLLAHRRRRFDAVVSTFHGPPKLLPGTPMIGFVHDLRLWNLNGPELAARNRDTAAARIVRAIWGTWDAAFVPSRHVAEDVCRLVPALPVVKVPEGLDHLGAPAPAGVPRDSLVVVAGHAPHKRAELGLLVAEKMCEELGCPAIVVGEVPRSPRDPRIEVHPQPSDDELTRLYRRGAVAIAPTSYEGFGLAAGEAMWFGVPVVYGKDSMLGDLVGAGGLAAEPTVEAFSEAVRRVWADRTAFSEAAEGIARQHTWHATAGTFVAEIAEMRASRS